MFTKFSITNFLSFQDTTHFSLASKKVDDGHEGAIFEEGGNKYLKTIAIYWPNASGKTSLLKALVVFKHWILNGFQLSISWQPIGVVPFLLSTETESRPTTFEMEFFIENKKYIYGFSAFPDRIHEEYLKKNTTIIFHRIGQDFSGINNTNGKVLNQWTGSVRSNVLFLSFLATVNWDLANKILGIIQEIEVFSWLDRDMTLNFSFDVFQKSQFHKDWMKKMIHESDFGIEDILSEEKQMSTEEMIKRMPPELIGLMFQWKWSIPMRQIQMLYKKYDKNKKFVGNVPFDFWTQSDGTREMFKLSWPIADVLMNGKTLCIDEIDSSLHPLLCRYIISLFNNPEINTTNARLIFTTHDISLLDKDFLRRDQIWFTDKDKYGVSDLFCLADLENRKDASFIKRYLEGRYGAIPYIKSLQNIQDYA